MNLMLKVLALLALAGCGALSGSEPADRAERARVAANAVIRGVEVTRDSCLAYVTYRSFLPAPEPVADELCRIFAPLPPIAEEPVTLPPQRAPEAPAADAGAPEAGP